MAGRRRSRRTAGADTLNAVIETWLLLLAIILGSVFAALSYSWDESTLTYIVRFAFPPVVGFAAGRVTATVALLHISKRMEEPMVVVETTARRLVEEIKEECLEEAADGDQEALDNFQAGKFSGVSALWHELERVFAGKAEAKG